MKRFSSLLAAALLTSVLGLPAVARDTEITEHFEFTRDVIVGSTFVKKGRYLVKFDTVSGQMGVYERGDLVVQVPATVRTHMKKFDSDALLTVDTIQGLKLTGLRLGGEREELVLTETVTVIDFEIIDSDFIDLQMQ